MVNIWLNLFENVEKSISFGIILGKYGVGTVSGARVYRVSRLKFNYVQSTFAFTPVAA